MKSPSRDVYTSNIFHDVKFCLGQILNPWCNKKFGTNLTHLFCFIEGQCLNPNKITNHSKNWIWDVYTFNFFHDLKFYFCVCLFYFGQILTAYAAIGYIIWCKSCASKRNNTWPKSFKKIGCVDAACKFVQQFETLFGCNIVPQGTKKLGSKIVPKSLLHQGTVFGTNKNPHR